MATKQEIAGYLAELKLSMDATFIPFSKSRNAAPLKGLATHELSLNWVISVKYDGRPLFVTDYSAGIAHCPAHNWQRPNTTDYRAHILQECETGREVKGRSFMIQGPAIVPDLCDVFASLAMDASAIDYPDFEAWASDYAEGSDSRAAEKIYNACRDTGQKLRAAMGNADFEELREIFAGY